MHIYNNTCRKLYTLKDVACVHATQIYFTQLKVNLCQVSCYVKLHEHGNMGTLETDRVDTN